MACCLFLVFLFGENIIEIPNMIDELITIAAPDGRLKKYELASPIMQEVTPNIEAITNIRRRLYVS